MKKRIRAVIIENRKVLLIHRIKGEREYWVFPGGGEEESDQGNDATTLRRECTEELGIEVDPGELFATEALGDSEERFYFCSIKSGNVGTGKGPEFQPGNEDKGKYLVEWLSRADLVNKKVLPEIIKEKLLQGGQL